MGRRLIAVCLCVVACRPERPPVYPTLPDGAPVRKLAAVGDLQRTGVVEILMGRETNDRERAALLRALAGEGADGVILLGDLVFRGDLRGDWETLDRLLAAAGLADRPLLAVVGNHEYWGPAGACRRFVAARFPGLRERTWYARRLPPLGLIILDTNAGALGPRRWAAQAAFYRETLRGFAADPEVRAVLVCAHHPPLTNHPYRPPKPPVRRLLLPPFLASRKTVALLSGHTHSYEHFVLDHRHLLVLGGGGGPRVRLLTGAAARFPDRFSGPPLRPFPYLVLTVTPGGLRFTVKGCRRGGERFFRLEEFFVPWP